MELRINRVRINRVRPVLHFWEILKKNRIRTRAMGTLDPPTYLRILRRFRFRPRSHCSQRFRHRPGPQGSALRSRM